MRKLRSVLYEGQIYKVYKELLPYLREHESKDYWEQGSMQKNVFKVLRNYTRLLYKEFHESKEH